MTSTSASVRAGRAVPAPRRRFREFHHLMRYRIQDVLLVATPYDTFVLEEAGELSERMLGEFRNLDLHYAPGLTGVATGEEALALATEQRRFNLIVATPQLADMNAVELARRVAESGLDVPVVVLARDRRELIDLETRHGLAGIERAFVWQGDASILVAIVKSVEDRHNVAHDAGELGVQVILLIEDRVRQYSSFLPAMYSELLHHSQRVISEGINLSQMILRMRARPKVLLATTWEEAERVFLDYSGSVLGIVSDVEFPRAGVTSPTAGADFARFARARYPDLPIVLHSSRPENRELAESLDARFLLKGSPFLLQELGRALLEDFGFGEFVFRLPDGEEVGRAANLAELEVQLGVVPDESILYHASRNHFSRWLNARTAFDAAHALRPLRPAEFESTAKMRQHLLAAVAKHIEDQRRVLVADFERQPVRGEAEFSRLGGGSLGGKARGLVFVRRILADVNLGSRFPGVEIGVPKALVLATDLFDRFLEVNELRRFAIECDDDSVLYQRFTAARLPNGLNEDLRAFLERTHVPLAVRSSSLLEDSQQHPFSGVYDTLMLANDAGAIEERVAKLTTAICRIYASTFTRKAKFYLRATGHRLEEEKMAVLVQRIAGRVHGRNFYPTLAGVARSVNFYPSGPMRSEDGVAAVALGFGRTVVEGEPCLRFSPRHPRHVPQLASTRSALGTTQRAFWALSLGADEHGDGDDAMRETRLDLAVAEADGELGLLGSTYAAADDVVTDGIARAGVRVVSFAPLLRHGQPPIAEIIGALLEEGSRGMGTAVEVEFAASIGNRQPTDFAVLQMRPLALSSGSEALDLGEFAEADSICRSAGVLGNGRIEGIFDLVVVDPSRFERARSVETAAAIGRINAQLVANEHPYLLFGVGRWGSRDPWLGIPVGWESISGARVMVEAPLDDIAVVPSQGSHFFQNLVAAGIGYFTIDPVRDDQVDWEWLRAQPAVTEDEGVRHLRLELPVEVRMDGRCGAGLVIKPGREGENRAQSAVLSGADRGDSHPEG